MQTGAWRVMGGKMSGPFRSCKRWVVLAAAFLAARAGATPPSEALMYAGDVESALRAAAEEARAAPGDLAAQERHVDVLLSLGLVDRAVAAARARMEAAPASPDGHYLLGRAFPSVDAARTAYERALKLDPNHARAHMGMGAIHTALGDVQSALDAYGRAVQLDPTLAEAWLGLTRAHLAKGDATAALAVCRRAMEAAPTSPEAYITAAILDPGTARPTLERAAKWAGRDARVHASLAELQLGAGEAEAALVTAGRALAIDPTDAAAQRVQLFGRAISRGALDVAGWRALLAAQEEQADAARWGLLVGKYPNTGLTWAGRSAAKRAAGDARGALADLAKAAEIDPGEPEIQGAYGLLLLQQGRPADALPWLQQASAARPWDPSLGMALGAALGKAGRPDEAVAVLSKLSARRRYDSEVAVAHADALLLAGKPDLAYQVVLDAAERRMDTRLMVALVAAATAAGRFEEAAGMLEEIGRSTGDARAAELAAKLRARAP